ncbi:Na+/H+ antiporter [Colletotrichum caudatum]|nr:Na+/H+ antiporter [Colletotrichum caudatum]
MISFSLPTPSPFDLAITGIGGWLLLSGAVSSLFKNRYHLSYATLSFLAGSFLASLTDSVQPVHFVEDGSIDAGTTFTLDLSRVVLGIQLLFAGVGLPSRYLRTEWKSLALLLGPGLVVMWISTTLVIWSLVGGDGISFAHAAAVAACVAPTDPILSSAILEGHFAEQNTPKALRDLIIAESGANDGLGYLFVFGALALVKHTTVGGGAQGIGQTLISYLVYTCLWVVGASVASGWVAGHLARVVLRWADKRGFIDRESLLAYSVALALFLLGMCGMLGIDDVLACFVAGNALTWDDWFRLETLDDKFQHAVDAMLNLVIFMWLGARCPWSTFWDGEFIDPWRLALIGLGVMLFRRLPIIMASYRGINQIEGASQGLFVGYFGPIGVSAVFYLCIGLDYLGDLRTQYKNAPASIERLQQLMLTIVWFLVASSVIVHGFSVPAAMFGLQMRDMLLLPLRSAPLTGRIALP